MLINYQQNGVLISLVFSYIIASNGKYDAKS